MRTRRAVGPIVVTCAVLAACLVWACASAFAAAPEAPEVMVESPVQATTATVHGVLNPKAAGEAGSYEFLYKEGNTGCAGGSKAPTPAGMAMGLQGEGVSEVLSALKPDTEYSVCLRVENTTHQEALSPTVMFMTLPEAPTMGSVEAQGSTVAVLKGELNPNGASGKLTYQFDYNTNGTCTVVKASPEEPPFQMSTPAVEVVEGKQDQVQAEAQGLEPNEQYTFCLVASNAQGWQASSNELSAQTGRQAPSIMGVSVTNTTSTEATISAEIYPHGEQATYQVEYGSTNTYGSSTTTVSISAQHGPAGIQAQLTGLTPNSEYHYRIVANNGTGSEQSPDTTFTTSEATVAGSQGLPDGRVYEMVTPPENENADVYVPEALNDSEDAEGIPTKRLFQVSSDGSAVAYEGDATSGGGNGEAGNGTGGNQFLAKRLSDGWVTNSIQPAGVFSTFYQGFSSNLSVGVLGSGTLAEPHKLPLSEEAPGGGYNVLYARVTSETGYRPLFTKFVSINRPAQESNGGFGINGGAAIGNGSSEYQPVFSGGSADFSDLLFEANDALLIGDGVLETELQNDVKKDIAEGKEHNENYLYESVGDKLSLIDVSPEGKVVPGATFGAPPLGNPKKDAPNFSGVISTDGSHVYWSSVETQYGEGKIAGERPTGLYLRDNPGEPQSLIVNGKCSVPDDACTVQVSGGGAQYWASAADGRYAFYTEGEELYRFDAEPEANEMSREVLTSVGAGVVGVLGVSEDGESVYFVAKGALAPGASSQTCEGGSAGTGCNVYLWHDGKTRLIATLSAEDGNQIEPFYRSQSVPELFNFGDWQPGLMTRTARVTGNGESLVFMSNQSLSVVGYPHGYPNSGAEEVYIYEAGSNSLFCASCGSTREGASGYLPVGWNDTGLPQWISQDGNRVFFDSGSSLVSQDTNGKQDVYEWEREGSGTCTNGSGVNGGCVFLLSGGTSPSNSWLIGASETGNDVFVATRAQLVPEDQNETFDLYDVRVDGVKQVSPPQCTGTGCQGVPSPPPTFATPSSVTFNGVGNFPPPVMAAVKAKAKTLSRAQKLSGALKACRKKPKRKRAACEVRARKRYTPVKKTRKGSRIVVKGRK